MCDESGDPGDNAPQTVADRLRVKLARGKEANGVKQIKKRQLPWSCGAMRDGRRGGNK